MENRDPIEDDPKYKDILAAVDQEIKEQIGDSRQLGLCHLIWGMKKQILKERYGIDWQSPADLNPLADFD